MVRDPTQERKMPPYRDETASFFAATMATLRTLSSPSYPPKLLYSQLWPFFFFFALHCLPHSGATPRISYSDHCNHIVPESPIDPSPSAIFHDSSLSFDICFFSGGESLSKRDLTLSGFPKSAVFTPFSLRRTLGGDKVYKIEANLYLRLPAFIASTDRNQRLSRINDPTNRVGYFGGPKFVVSGFWSESTGQVCMVGSGDYDLAEGVRWSYDVVLKLNYSEDANIYGSLIHGMLESVKGKSTQSYFEPISLIGLRKIPQNYEFKLLEQGKSECGTNRQESLSLERGGRSLCSIFIAPQTFVLRYGTGCNGSNHGCSPLGSTVKDQPQFMTLYRPFCDGEKMNMLLSFNKLGNLVTFRFDPTMSLLVEGAWDTGKNRFCGVACRILNVTGGHARVDDCSLRLSLSFPAVLSLRRMGLVVGQLWSIKSDNRIEFLSLKDSLDPLPGLRYEYTESKKVEKFCGRSHKVNARTKGKHYPDAQTSDMRFHMSTKTRGDTPLLSGRATPLFVGDHLYSNILMTRKGAAHGVDTNVNNVINSFTNISYRIHFRPVLNSVSDTFVARVGDIYAEGIYDRNSGELCMVGCQRLSINYSTTQINDSLDCSIVINVKFSPIESKSDYRVNGIIESTREKNDTWYFGRIEFTSRSIYSWRAEESVWRMNLEIIMVVISNMLSCVFVGLQLYHMKKHPEVLPFISIVMLMILTLGHMIPLLMNFEAMFKSNENRQNMFFDNDGWIEAKEIVVRMVTMVAFLLEFRVLQLVWTARKNENDNKGERDAEKKVFYICLPLYITGGLIAWIANRYTRPREKLYFRRPYPRHLLYRPYNLKRTIQRPSMWKDLRSYGGLLLEGFLLPQILFNALSDSNVKALAGSFYVGTSVVRLLPHAYDLYRSHSYGSSLDWSFIYANHKTEYYSTVWDIVIPCTGFAFAFFIFVQQRFGGRSFLPKRFRGKVGYEKVGQMGNVIEMLQTSS